MVGWVEVDYYMVDWAEVDYYMVDSVRNSMVVDYFLRMVEYTGCFRDKGVGSAEDKDSVVVAASGWVGAARVGSVVGLAVNNCWVCRVSEARIDSIEADYSEDTNLVVLVEGGVDIDQNLCLAHK